MTDLLRAALLPFQQLSPSYLALALIALACAPVGVFVLLRRIVFVGVALAEVSALGIGFAFFTLALLPAGALFEVWHHWGPLASAAVFACIFVGLLAFSPLAERVSREAFIGVVHALAAGLALLLVWRSAEGLEELRHILGGDVLYVHDRHLAALAAVAALVLGLHAALGRGFALVAFDPDVAASQGFRVARWEALHLGLIGGTIAAATWTGGVMLAFGLLLVPGFAALALAGRLAEGFGFALTLALGAVAVGLEVAYHLDYPIPPAVVTALLVPLGAVALERASGLRRLAWVVAAPGALLAAVGVVVALADLAGAPLFAPAAPRSPFEPRPASAKDHVPHHEAPRLREPRARIEAARELGRGGDPRARPTLEALFADPVPEVRAAALEALVRLGDPAAGDAIHAGARALSPDLRLEAARALLGFGDARGAELLVDMLAEDGPPFVRDEAARALEAHLGRALDYDALRPHGDPANRAALDRARAALEDRRGER